ncbi:hypothetical protein [Taibaiella soli]|uniref:Uncharacterized protein n=1 Tax=Taibaiella soli TaxID=1649169 RepID=A0A2W2AH71_9BACT|nr:hypothetical protein [Taibaiella soli]PZF74621.1 hypothetical protein DN068_03325 [Taibaiella soli]
MPIPVYIINLKPDAERVIHCINEFGGRSEFSIQIVPVFEHKIDAIGFWNTIIYILQNLTHETDEYVIICKDSHSFTKHYSPKQLAECITIAQSYEADILNGCSQTIDCSINTAANVFKTDIFSGIQFTVIFQKFFKTIIAANFVDSADYKISMLTKKKFFIHPFISVEKDFSYTVSSNNFFNQNEG